MNATTQRGWQWLVGLLFIGAGANHFILPKSYLSMMPSYLPAHALLVQISGVAEILGGLGVFLARTRRLAAYGLILLLVAVFPANLNAALHGWPGGSVPGWALWCRLPLQPVFIWWIYRIYIAEHFSIASEGGGFHNRAMQARKTHGRKGVGGRGALLLAALVVCGQWFAPPASGAPPPADSEEDQRFRYAFNLFDGKHSQQAETNFSDFLAQFTNSPHRAEAILYLARARLEQSNYTGAIELLQKSSPAAGKLTADYDFWIAKARFSDKDYTNAAEGFAAVAKEAKDFPDFSKRLDAAYDEAEAHSRMADWPGVVRLLQQTDGPFRQAAAADAKSQYATMGWLLLGEALFQEGDYADGEKLIGGLDANGLTPDFLWQRLYLLCRLQLAGKKADAALGNSTNLLELATGPSHQAASFFLQGQILEKLDRPADALRVYTNNIVDSQPPGVQRQSLARIVDLTVALDTPAAAIQALDALIAKWPQASALDLAWISLGELYLKADAIPTNPAAGTNALAAPDPRTNALGIALAKFSFVITNFTNSELLPKARLDRGWCYWLATNIAPAKADFEFAAVHLPVSEDQAVARFKLADAQFLQQDYAGAAGNYNLVLSTYDKFPSVTNALFDRALYQIAEADFRRGDTEGAREAVTKILKWYPVSYFGDRGLLLMGEDLNRKPDYASARAVFTNLLEHSPHSPLAPEVQYAIARTYDHEGNWNEAIRHYNQWETNNAGDSLRPEVEFHLALARAKAGLTNNALAGFTNFVARFPSNALAPWALNSVADYYYNQGDFSSAEKNYQKLFQTYPGAGELAYQAQFWAGKAALAWQGTEQARGYFVNLVKDTNAPPALVEQSWFALGDTRFQQFQDNPTNKTWLDEAIAAMSKLTNGAPTNAISVEALGRLGDYQMYWADLQWAATNRDTNSYAAARQMYETIIGFPATSVSVPARSQAEVGLGRIAEQQLQPQQALAYYYKVLYSDPARSDPYWVERAGESAARICEDQQHWVEAFKVYDRVLEIVPALRPVLEKKKAAAQARLDAARR